MHKVEPFIVLISDAIISIHKVGTNVEHISNLHYVCTLLAYTSQIIYSKKASNRKENNYR